MQHHRAKGSDNRPDVTLFIPTLVGGGAERVMISLAGGMREQGYNVDLLLVEASGPLLAEVPEGVRVVELGSKRTSLSLPAIRRYVGSSGTPVVISALHNANLATLFARKLFRLPTRVIVTVHNSLSAERAASKSIRGKVQHGLIGTSYRWADKIVAVSNETADDFAASTGINRDAITTIYNPVIADDLFKKAKESITHPWFAQGEPPVILGMGRLTKQKDFATLIRSFSLVVKKLPARLMILGEGGERTNLEKLVRELGLTDDVALPGFVSNPFPYLQRARAFALSSRWEGLGNVLIEALALGVPVVSTACQSGPREILADGKYGELVPVGDSNALADAISSALKKPTSVTDDASWTPYTRDASVEAYLRVAAVRKNG